MSTRPMRVAVTTTDNYGNQPHAWRAEGVDPRAFADFDAAVRQAQKAERALADFLFFPDSLGLRSDVSTEPNHFALEPLMTMAAIARGTERIGMVTTASTTYNEPYNFARMLKTLDVMSHGRVGWNVIPTADPTAAANFGTTMMERQAKYERLHEFVQVVEGLWGSWGEDAFIGDQASGRFADASKVQPVNLQGPARRISRPAADPPVRAGAACDLPGRRRRSRTRGRRSLRQRGHRRHVHDRGLARPAAGVSGRRGAQWP